MSIASPAQAQCPNGDGTVPGTGNSVTRVGLGDATPYGTIYIDDRDSLDLDEDDNAGGVWIYWETNNVSGLQRGGVGGVGKPIDDVFDWTFPVAPIVVLPPDPNRPVRPQGLTLFPDGIGGGYYGGYASRDDCNTSEDGSAWTGPADTILF